jgi:uncharacterized protein
MGTESSTEALLLRLRMLLPDLRKRYSIDTLEIFGSRARAKADDKSDLDILVTFSETPDLLILISLENELSEELGLPVDVVVRRALKPRLRDRILREAIPV